MVLDSDSIYKQQKVERERRDTPLERERFLNLRHLPARMTIEEVAAFFRMSSHDIPVLVANGLLKPLGDPDIKVPSNTSPGRFWRNYPKTQFGRIKPPQQQGHFRR